MLGRVPEAEASGIGQAELLGVVPAGLGFFLWNKGVAKVSAAVGGVMNTLKAPLAVLIAWSIFGEHIDLLRTTASLALMILAVRMAKAS